MTATDNQKAMLAEHQAADQAAIDASDAEERKTLGSLLGNVIVEAARNSKTGIYELVIDDGRIIRFDIYGPRDAPYLGVSVVTMQH
jgi:hypothetical protein